MTNQCVDPVVDTCTKCGWPSQSCDCCGLCGEPECDCALELNGDQSEPLGPMPDDIDDYDWASPDDMGAK